MAMTRKQMLEGRKCGLKYWDKATALLSRLEIIDKAVAIHKEFPNTWGPGWRNFDWALGNAVREIACPKTEPRMSWNVNDVLTEDEMKYVADRCQFTGEYEPCWARKEGK